MKKNLENNNKRFMMWEEPDSAHPNILRKVNFEAIRTSENIFARKFDQIQDEEILDMIDREILQLTSVAVIN